MWSPKSSWLSISLPRSLSFAVFINSATLLLESYVQELFTFFLPRCKTEHLNTCNCSRPTPIHLTNPLRLGDRLQSHFHTNVFQALAGPWRQVSDWNRVTFLKACMDRYSGWGKCLPINQGELSGKKCSVGYPTCAVATPMRLQMRCLCLRERCSNNCLLYNCLHMRNAILRCGSTNLATIQRVLFP